jgi:carotenoid 1,2-hydratase
MPADTETNAATDRKQRSADAPAPPRFDVNVPHSGYRWWYVDGISDDGRHGIVVIAFIGSVFSPYYFRARSRGPANPLDYCAINVGLYRASGKLWAMTERSRRAVEREATWFRVGSSSLEWRGDCLTIDIDERSMPFGRSMTGKIRVHPEFLNGRVFELDPDGRHEWQPVAPVGRIEVDMQRPAHRWSGTAYFDTNCGSRALEDDFEGWNWSRHGNELGARITYAASLLDGAESSLALRFDRNGRMERIAVPPEVGLPGTGWRVARSTRAVTVPTVSRTLEDTPFYARSILEINGENDDRELVMHESLSLSRFKSSWVRLLLPFRMPRVS